MYENINGEFTNKSKEQPPRLTHINKKSVTVHSIPNAKIGIKTKKSNTTKSKQNQRETTPSRRQSLLP